MSEGEAFAWFRRLLKINTTNSLNNEIEAAEYIQDILNREGIDSELFENEPKRTNLVSKLDGGDEPPLLLISHLDVVRADESMWTYPPFSATVSEGEVWARGTLDTKHLTIMQLAAFIELKRQNIPLDRDVYFIATADEEDGSDQGMRFMKNEYPEYLPNGTVINEGGGFYVSYREKDYLLISVGEKGSCSLDLVTKGQSGHASCPPDDQAIQKMSAVITRLLNNPLPEAKTDIADTFLRVLGIDKKSHNINESLFDKEIEDENLLWMLYNYMTANDINIKQVVVGEQINAIPYKASAEIEFKLLPGTSKEEIRDFVKTALNGLDVEWEIKDFQSGFISNTESSIVSMFEDSIKKFGFKGRLLPFLALGKTDGRFLKDSTVYGFSPVSQDTPFAEVLKKVHQPDESISINSFLFGTQVIRETVLNYCQQK